MNRRRRPLLLAGCAMAVLALAPPVMGQSTSTPWPAPASQAQAATPSEHAPSAQPQMEAYPLSGQTRNVLLAWQDYAAGRTDIRVAIDERSSQALVFAPEAVHEQIRRQLAAGQTSVQPANHESGAARQASQSSPRHDEATTAQPPANGTLQLRHLRAGELHRRLERMLSRPLPVSSDASGQWEGFAVELAPGVAVTMHIHRQANVVRIDGPPEQTAAWRSVVEALDRPPTGNGVMQLAVTSPDNRDRVRKALNVLQAQGSARSATAGNASRASQRPPQRDGPSAGLAAMLFQPSDPPDSENQPATPPPGIDPARVVEAAGDLLGPVDIEYVEGLDVIVIRGAERDVQRVMEVIEEIERLAIVTVPEIVIHPLENVDSASMAGLMERLYDQVLGPRIGEVSITPLVKPNALLLIGRAENVRMAVELIERLDQPVAPATRFEVFPLRHAAAPDVRELIEEFLEEEQLDDEPTLAPRVLVVADVRTNSLIVSAGPRDMAEVAALVDRIDQPSGAAVDVVRIFPLQNALATELAEVLQGAIQAVGTGQPDNSTTTRPSALEFLTIGGPFQSGILTNVRVTAEPRANALVVTAPAESMELIAALITQLDQVPGAVAELKVFTLQYGDATALAEVLRELFAPEVDPAAPGGIGTGLVRLHISVDQRTNSIIVAGAREELAVVEAILLRLDEREIRERQTTIYRLNNAFVQDVALALNEWLQTEREIVQEIDAVISPFLQLEREVVIVPEIATNSLIISATPRYFDEVIRVVRELDERPPMVMIQVLIAEVRLNDTDEFGVELGLQDSLLFDRSLLSEFQTITQRTTEQIDGTAITTEEQIVINAPMSPGFNFGNPAVPLGNNASTVALQGAGKTAAQGLSHFAVGRVSDLGFGGFVFSATSNSINILLRAMQENRRLEVLSRPQIMALDGQMGRVQVGQNVPTIRFATINQFGQTNSIEYVPVGLILNVLPRISPDGLVVMQIQAIKAEVGPEAEGIPIQVTPDGQVIRAPRIENTEAITTVSAVSGQTVVLSGLLQTRKFDLHRSVPLISDVPLLGDLFRYDAVQEERRELLIILTPQIVHDRIDAERLKQVESARMSWIMADVISLHGPAGLRGRCDEWSAVETDTIYPTWVPSEKELMSPAPGASPPVLQEEPLPAPEPTMELAPPATPRDAPSDAGPRPSPSAPATPDARRPPPGATTAHFGQSSADGAVVQPVSYPAPKRLPQPGMER